jgi:hydrogenase nickel incorporation protein HypB
MPREVIVVERDVLATSRASAEEFRRKREACGTLVINLVSSPGAGKTSLLQATAAAWRDRFSMAVLVGDLATDRDAQRLAPYCEVVQMTTGGACHLELPLVERAFDQLRESRVDFLFIENVGNLVCPASHILGEHLRIVLLSVTEGDDKPQKYPKMFRTSQAMVVSKVDLLPHVPFSVDTAAIDARRVQPGLEVLGLSALSGDGVADWCRFLERERQQMFARRK